MAVFGAGLMALGALFQEPGDDVRSDRTPAPPAALRLGAWQPAGPEPAPVAAPEPRPAATPQPDHAVEVLPEDRTAPTNVWATPAQWSEAD